MSAAATSTRPAEATSKLKEVKESPNPKGWSTSSVVCR
jgi:hypothetical protein